MRIRNTGFFRPLQWEKLFLAWTKEKIWVSLHFWLLIKTKKTLPPVACLLILQFFRLKSKLIKALWEIFNQNLLRPFEKFNTVATFNGEILEFLMVQFWNCGPGKCTICFPKTTPPYCTMYIVHRYIGTRIYIRLQLENVLAACVGQSWATTWPCFQAKNWLMIVF